MPHSQSRPFLALALFAIAVASLPAQADLSAEEISDLNWTAIEKLVDQWVTPRARYRTIDALRTRLNELLEQRISMIDRTCGLSTAQKKRLDLTGRGSIKKLFEDIQTLQGKVSEAEKNNPPGAARLLGQGPEASLLRSKLRSGPFDDDSLFAKSLKSILSEEQFLKYEELPKLAANSDKPITVMNAAELVRTSRLQRDINQIAWSRDGTQLGLLEFNKHVEVHAPSADQLIRTFGEGKKVVKFDFGPRNDLVAITENSDVAFIIDASAGREIPLQTGQPQPQVRFSPDGKLLATGGYGTKAKLWSVETGELIREFDTGSVVGGLTVAFSPDGTVLAVGNRNSTTNLFSVATGKLLWRLPKDQSHGLKFDPTGKTLAVTYVNGSLVLWDVESGQVKRSDQA